MMFEQIDEVGPERFAVEVAGDEVGVQTKAIGIINEYSLSSRKFASLTDACSFRHPMA